MSETLWPGDRIAFDIAGAKQQKTPHGYGVVTRLGVRGEPMIKTDNALPPSAKIINIRKIEAKQK